MDDLEQFRENLEMKKLSPTSIYLYLNYHQKMTALVNQSAHPFDQQLVDSFLGWKNNTVARSYLKHYFQFTKNKDLEITKITGRKPRKKPNIISKNEIAELLEFLYKWEQRWGLMFALTLECALRKNELLEIDSDDFAWEGWLEDRTKPCRLKIKGKGNKERFVVVPAYLMEKLLEYFKKHPQGDNPTFFKIKKSRWDAVFRHACLRCFGKPYKLHEIRHTRATQWYDEGKDITQIKNRLGHASISTTQLYINPDEEQEISRWEEET